MRNRKVINNLIIKIENSKNIKSIKNRKEGRQSLPSFGGRKMNITSFPKSFHSHGVPSSWTGLPFIATNLPPYS